MKPLAVVTLTSLLFSGYLRATPAEDSALEAALKKIDPEIKPEHYDIARADVDSDGKDDVFVLMNGKSGYCGSGGCTLFILRSGKDGLAQAGRTGVVNRPVLLRKSSHHGLRDVLVRVQGGGATPGNAVLEFDGSSYPAAPGEPTAKADKEDTILFPEPPAPFSTTARLQGISFQVTSPNTIPANTVTITPAGLEKDNQPVTVETKDLITGAEIADINADGSPEIYVYTAQSGADRKGGLLAWSANKKKSLSQITVAAPAADAKELQGYRGGDEFAVVEGIIARRFPVYPDDKSAAKPTGRIRQFQYKLVPGEASWQLKLDKMVEF